MRTLTSGGVLKVRGTKVRISVPIRSTEGWVRQAETDERFPHSGISYMLSKGIVSYISNEQAYGGDSSHGREGGEGRGTWERTSYQNGQNQNKKLTPVCETRAALPAQIVDHPYLVGKVSSSS